MEHGNCNLSDLGDELAGEHVYLKLALEESLDGWVTRHLDALVRSKPETWSGESWRYERFVFVACEVSGEHLVASLEGVLGEFGGYKATVSFADQIYWERKPSRARFADVVMPWPTLQYQLTRSVDVRDARPQGFLVSDSAPSFPGYDTAFRAFFHGNFARFGTPSPSEGGFIRIAKTDAWIKRVHIDAGRVTVDIGGASADGASLELNSSTSQTRKRVGTTARVRFRAPSDLFEETWLYLSLDRKLLDYRAIGSRVSSVEEMARSGVQIELPDDPATTMQAIMAAGEGLTVEYKSVLPDGGDDAKRKVLKTVAAFANGDGGTIAFGVDADEMTPVGLLSAGPKDRDRLTSLVESLVVPTPAFDVHTYSVGGKDFLLINVSAGASPPYGLRFKGGPIEYYVRRGASTYPARPEDLRTSMMSRMPSPAPRANPYGLG